VFPVRYEHLLHIKSKAIPVIGCGDVFPVGHVARMREKRNVYRLLVGKSEGKRPLGRSRLTWIDNIKMDLFEIGLSFVD
jgi:hypothetical protein